MSRHESCPPRTQAQKRTEPVHGESAGPRASLDQPGQRTSREPAGRGWGAGPWSSGREACAVPPSASWAPSRIQATVTSHWIQPGSPPVYSSSLCPTLLSAARGNFLVYANVACGQQRDLQGAPLPLGQNLPFSLVSIVLHLTSYTTACIHAHT